jgi:hypothetical protein
LSHPTTVWLPRKRGGPSSAEPDPISMLLSVTPGVGGAVVEIAIASVIRNLSCRVFCRAGSHSPRFRLCARFVWSLWQGQQTLGTLSPHQSNATILSSHVPARLRRTVEWRQIGLPHFGITPVTFRAGTSRSTMRLDCVLRGGIRGWVNVSPNQDGRTLPTLTG